MTPDGPAYGHDPAAADGLVAAVTGASGHVTGVVPSGYPAYARVLHPADGPDGPVPWARVAAAAGTRVHPLAQWHRVVGTSGFSRPDVGRLEPEVLALLVGVLARHTTTPGDCWYCLWEGYGSLHGSPAVAVLGSSEPVPPAADRSVLNAARVLLPGRGYLLGRGPLSAALRSGWAVPPTGWFDPQSPNLFWPADRAWAVGTEIDLDSTLVAGSEALVGDLLATPGVEAWPVGPEDSLRAGADRLNG